MHDNSYFSLKIKYFTFLSNNWVIDTFGNLFYMSFFADF